MATGTLSDVTACVTTRPCGDAESVTNARTTARAIVLLDGLCATLTFGLE